jgi:hypothetical protein
MFGSADDVVQQTPVAALSVGVRQLMADAA